MKRFSLGLCVALIGHTAVGASGAQRPPTPPAAREAAKPPAVPATLVNAKTAFLINEAPGPAGDADFRALQGELRKWNRFQIVDRADRADVTVSLSTREEERVSEIGAPRGARLVNPRTAVVRRNVSTLTIRQRSTNEVLWMQDNEAVPALVRTLQRDLPVVFPSFCFAVWCR